MWQWSGAVFLELLQGHKQCQFFGVDDVAENGDPSIYHMQLTQFFRNPTLQ